MVIDKKKKTLNSWSFEVIITGLWNKVRDILEIMYHGSEA